MEQSVLIFGDVVGRIGRETLMQRLPDLCTEHKPDLIIANCENLAHGFGINERLIKELHQAGIDAFTSGNHIWANPGFIDVFANPGLAKRVVRPLNTNRTEGIGYTIVEKAGIKYLIGNLSGVTFMENEPNPFNAVDKMLAGVAETDFDISLIDFHAETTSEKAVLSRYLDGRVSCLWGTHTHVPTADERILPQGTATITDVGMVGAHNEAIGGRYDLIVKEMKTGGKGKYEVPTEGPVEINAILVKVNSDTGQASSIERIREIV